MIEIGGIEAIYYVKNIDYRPIRSEKQAKNKTSRLIMHLKFFKVLSPAPSAPPAGYMIFGCQFEFCFMEISATDTTKSSVYLDRPTSK